MNRSAVCAEIIQICKALYEKRLIAGMDGNVSAKTETGTVLITPSGAHKGFMFEDALIEVNMAGQKLAGKGEASSELSMHLAIYRAEPNVNAIVHAHPPYCLGLSLAGISMLPHLTAEGEMSLKDIAYVPFALPGTEALAEAVAQSLAGSPVQILAHHGAVSRGKDLREAFSLMECLEHNAMIAAISHGFGHKPTPVRL